MSFVSRLGGNSFVWPFGRFWAYRTENRLLVLCERSVLCELPGECYFSHWLSIPAAVWPKRLGPAYKAQCTTRPGALFLARRSRSATPNKARCELLLRTIRAAIANHCCLRESMSCALRWRAFSRWC